MPTLDIHVSENTIVHAPYITNPEVRREFKTLRQKIRVLMPETATIAVCGTQQGEGTSWAVAMLACATAEDSAPVLVVDGDVVKRSQRVGFGNSGQRLPLPRAVESEFELHGTSCDGIFVLSAPEPDSFGEREAGMSLCSLLPALRSQWRHVLVDCPPVPESSLLLDIARVVDGVILVVHAERERRDALQDKLEWLKRLGAPLLGIVLNTRKRYLPRFLQLSI